MLEIFSVTVYYSLGLEQGGGKNNERIKYLDSSCKPINKTLPL